MLGEMMLASPRDSALPDEEPDGKLIQLGAAFEAAWSAERALDGADHDRFEAAHQATQAIVDQIEKLPATTLKGFRIKARAVAWFHLGEDIELSGSRALSDTRLAESLIRDLLALPT
jgi:hypothetical protein